jgi:antibiotic biosynthesis monooxygenase (ABM) superfamily enzyme
MKKPQKWKMALLTWACIYPLINIIFITIFPLTDGWHPMLRTLLTTVILVPLMGIMLDLLKKWVGEWLYK